MISRILAVLGLGVALAFAPQASAFAQSKPATTKSAAATSPVVKKKIIKKKVVKKKTNSKIAKAKKPVQEEIVEKPKGLFATLFGGGLKSGDGATQKAAAAKTPAAKATASAKPEAKSGKKLVPVVTKPVVLTATQSAYVASGNNAELRSETEQGGGLLSSLFGAEDQLLPETRALDTALRNKQIQKKPFQVAGQYQPQTVSFSGYPSGTIVVDTANHFLYYVEGLGKARRYGIAVGKDGLKFKGNVTVGDKQEWPRWIPTLDMQKREPKKYGKYKDGMPGGGANPLGARAIYLYQGKQDTHLRIHGTIAPESIGTDSSNGCFRMVNEHVMDLYRRVRVGTNVVVL